MFEELVPILIPATFAGALVLERVFPARKLPSVKRWFGKGIVFFVLSAAMNAVIPAIIAEPLARFAPLPLEKLGVPLAVLATVLATELVGYWLHRTMHTVPWIWRWTHQMHHSAERVDILGATYFHPFDFALNIGITTAVASLLGVGGEAAAIAGYGYFCLAMFQHLNVRTPWWIGYIVQRPEGHSVHHARGVHAYNYGNLAISDLVFGTFKNPKEFVEEAGFWDGASARVGAMLLGRDVAEPPAPARAGADAGSAAATAS
jgi:sterol desaturase/sphingolipid hydroxylase (fatty acid hydroxylase superfamily)